MRNYKKGDSVLIQDGQHVRAATVVEDGIDNKNRVRVRPDNYPMDISIPLEKNDRLYIVQ
jgi:hypothetical protein|tara:strand:+ start:1159 stop:1338 length:180 start_codon:yes stop_codon:yes gene_type:complete